MAIYARWLDKLTSIRHDHDTPSSAYISLTSSREALYSRRHRLSRVRQHGVVSRLIEVGSCASVSMNDDIDAVLCDSHAAMKTQAIVAR